MKRKEIKKEIHNAIDLIDDKDFLKFVRALLNKKLENFELSRDEKKELDTLKELHKSGKSKSYTVAEVREHAYEKLSEQ